MLAYKYSAKTNEYIGQTIVLRDPLESEKLGKEVLAFPPRCVLMAPPEVAENEVAIYDEDKEEWVVVPDFRGSIIYSKKGNSMILEEIGEIPTNYSLEKPVTLQDLKVEKIEEAKKLYNSMITATLEVGKLKVTKDDMYKLQSSLTLFERHNIISYDNSDEETVLVTKNEVEEAEKYLYIYITLLGMEKSSLLNEIRTCTNKKNLLNIEVKFDIDKKLKELMKLSTEELDEYFKVGV